MRDELVKISESGQGAAHTALGKTQNVFCQATRGIDIRLAALDQQSAQAAFNDQLHLLCDLAGSSTSSWLSSSWV